MKKTLDSSIFHFLILIIISSSIIGFHYKAIFENFNTNKTSDIYRDGIKTVLNATYHAKYSDSYTWFEGMNYPYKEHIMAATELPGVAIIFKFLHPYFPWITDHAFGIIHVLLLSCILLGCIFIYLTFKELNIPWYLAILFSIGITFLAPQNMRIQSHMGLAPLFVIPSIIYFLLRLEKTGKLKYAAFLGVSTFIASFLHFYFFAIIAIFTSLFFLFSFLKTLKFTTQKIYTETKKLIIQFSIGIGIPLLFFLYWMILNDSISDRSPNPYGFLVYHSNFTNIFSSPHLPLFEWINKDWFLKTTVDFEGWSYIGLVADLFLILILLKWIIGLFKKNLFYFIPKTHSSFFANLFFAGGVMAYLSCSQPFIMEGWDYLLQYTGPYKQFRSTGRFAWAFYFSINIIAFAGFYHLIQLLKNKKLKLFLFTLIISISFYEAYTFHNNSLVYKHYNLRHAPELEPGNEFTSVTDIDFSKYQGIIPSPLFIVGTNNFEAPGSAYVVQQALVLSNQTGLPITGAMLTRASHSHGLNQFQLVSEPYRTPKLFEDLKNNKPFILLESKTKKEEFKIKYDHLKEEATLLHKGERWSLYELTLESFHKKIENKNVKIKDQIENDTLFHVGEFLSNHQEQDFIYKNFDESVDNEAYFSKGCYKGIVGEENVLFNDTLPNPTTIIDYTFQLWVNVNPDKFASTTFKVTETLSNGHINILAQTSPSWSTKIFDSNGWVLLEMPFRISGPKSVVTVSFKKHEDYDKREILVDELLIKPQDTHLYKEEREFIWYNNQVFYN